MASGIDADFYEVLAGSDVEQSADPLVELVYRKSGHFGEHREPQWVIVVAVNVVDGSGEGRQLVAG